MIDRPLKTGICHSLILCTGLLYTTTLQCGRASGADRIDFRKEIEPIFRTHCVDCHGPEEQESEFRIDRLANMIAGGNSGEPAIVRGNTAASFLLKLIRHQVPDKKMPPDGSLSKDEIDRIEKWIAQGAETPDDYGPAEAEIKLSHWSFLPVVHSESATIDGLISDKLKQNGLKISRAENRRTLIRRLYLVMLGVPPKPQQVEEFVTNDSEAAWSELVEQVLASTLYGERWASYWLDLVRFGETHGFEMNRERPNAWQYRDWVIQALNDDKPYDEFVREQIAGDAFGSGVATGFLVAGPNDQVKGQDPKLRLQQRMNELDDIINTTGTAFLGLTTGCARCHNHKFDPISQRDYYAMQAIFAGVQHGVRSLKMTEETLKQIAELDAKAVELKEKLKPFLPRPSSAAILIEEPTKGTTGEAGGIATKPAKTASHFGGTSYTWWNNKPGKEIAIYQPRVRGSYRIWLSWGAGHLNHSSDAKYLIKSTSGTRELATINQQLVAGGTGVVDNVTKWSGFQDAGVHEFAPDDTIVLLGGSKGPAVTADAILLQPTDQTDPTDQSNEQLWLPTKRPAVNAKQNDERFPPRKSKFVRFTIKATNSAQGCLDELEIFSAGRNVALASSGAKATSSGDFVHPRHRLEQINDGQHGNDRSWIVKSKTGGWVQIELAEPAVIDRVSWGRDRTGVLADRLPTSYRIEAGMEQGKWELLASSADRHSPKANSATEHKYQFTHFPAAEAEQAKSWLDRLIAVQTQLLELNQATVVYAGTFSQPGPTYRLYRGEPDAQREQVSPDAIEVFTSLDLKPDSPEQSRRISLADWITNEDNPLTRRVIVNRIWQFHFGTGIVDTPSDFGHNGIPPTHPELLDHLASELLAHDWSLKHIHRLILNSATWRQSDQPNSQALRIDADSRLLWRFPPRRLEAEAIRDSILTVTGVLDLENSGGPGFNPFEVEMENVRHYHAKKTYGPEDWRRMVYMTKVRQEREHVFGAFDCPDASMVVPKRSRSTTPLQALNLLNSQFIMQQADLFAERLEHEAPDHASQVIRAWKLCFQRDPTARELTDSTQFIEQQGLQQFTRAVLNTNEFVFIP